MTSAELQELIDHCARLRTEPQLPYRESRGRSKSELQGLMSGVRAEIVAAIEQAPDAAFAAQPANGDAEEVWSIGEIVGHCNAAVRDIGGRALGAGDVELDTPADPDSEHVVSRVRDRAEALEAAHATEFQHYFDALPDDERLDRAHEAGFFETMSARSWLYFMVIHEAEHVAQIRDLSQPGSA